MRRIALLLGVGAIATLTAAPPAIATDYCVTGAGLTALHAECGGADETADGFNEALGFANSNPGLDRIFIGPGTVAYEGASLSAAADQGLIVDGSGRDATIMQADGGAPRFTANAPDTVISDLEVRLGPASNVRGLDVFGGTVERVDVTGSPGGSSTGLTIDDAVDLDDVVVDLPPAGVFQTGVVVLDDTGSTGSTLTDVRARATEGMRVVNDAHVDLQRGVYEGTNGGIVTTHAASLTGDSFVARGLAEFGDGLDVRYDNPGAPPDFLIRHATLFAPSGGVALRIRDTQGGQVDVDVENTALTGPGTDIHAEAFGAGSIIDLTLSYSAWLVGEQSVTESGGGDVVIGFDDTNLPGAGTFFAPEAGDFRIRGDSPLVDAGSPALLDITESPTDYLGGNRILDGDGDTVADRDIGAEEFDPADPPLDPPVPGDGDPTDDPPAGDTTPTGPPQAPGGPPQSLPLVLPPPVLAPLAVRRGDRRLDRRARITFVIDCPATAAGSCAGNVLVRTTGAVVVQGRRRILTLGRKAFAIAAGRRGRVRVKVGRRALRALRRARRLRVSATVTSTNASSTRLAFTLRPRRR